ncbi:MAG: 4'-phosphopantetheinyl transferase superfamily protein [Clostridia bacterium]|nr:4'-phosphopantetheinyl transferase superfamily protein [Clostridia bacterium]
MIGFDLQETSRIKNEDKLLAKIALESEIAYINRFAKQKKERTASLWSVKEAVFKSLDVCEGDISYKEIELCHKESGAPYIKLYGKALKRLKELGGEKVEVSISHQKNVVGVVAIIK